MSKGSDDRFWDEYKILQEKLDKIGDFRFRVKAWFVGILTGLLFTSSATGMTLSTAGAALFVGLAFWFLERHHLHWQRAIEGRACDIEQVLSSGRVHGETFHRSPQIVDAILAADAKLRRRRSWQQIIARRWRGFKAFLSDARSTGIVAALTRNSDDAFYVLLLIAALALIGLHAAPADKALKVELPQPLSAEIKAPVVVEVRTPVSVDVAKPVSVDLGKRVSIEVSKPVSIEVGKPVPVEIGKPMTVDIKK